MANTHKIGLYILTSLIGLFFFSPASALEMTSKRDCVVCHIMWMDDFRTEKDTLIEWQPTNVLMRDTQGVVSSEEICYSCHDGYVNDSRYNAWNYNRHKVYVKPSKNVSIPMNMPLSVHGEIYCGTCHSAHGRGAAPHGNPMGVTSFFRETKVDSNLCEMCHRNESAFENSLGHPIHTAALTLPDDLFSLGGKKAKNRNMVICQSCHIPHGAKGEKILITTNKNSELCVLCHEKQRNLIETKHDLRVTLPDEKNFKDKSVAESGPCGACHTPHNSAGKRLWARPLSAGNPATQMCLTCHAENSGYNIKGVGIHSHPINIEPSEKTSVPDTLPLFSAYGSKDPSGKVQCFTCHDVHLWDPSSTENRGGKDVEGNSSNSFLRISNSLSSDLCIECHTDKKQLISSDHNMEITAPEEKNIQGFIARISGPCGSCHIPHNASARNIWAKEISSGSDFMGELCTGCHSKSGAAKAKVIEGHSHPTNVTLEKFNITTSLPLYTEYGEKIPNGEIACMTCHDPHTWDPSNPVVDNSFENTEGNALNSFLRKTNFPSSDLCKNCHADKALIDGSDHDLNVTAPEAKNILGQTVKESGQCGACHLVHNSPNKIKLWARQLGLYYRGENMVNNLCTSCHSRGNIAELKIPLIATHPQKRLINNIMRSNRTSLDFAPIYDQQGNEVHVGNISCPTCHNAHQWSPLVQRKGSGRNLEGNATNSFLRNVSYDNICIDCHGLDALFRYKYYHNPHERVEQREPFLP
jgi:predicted CXXCH cytochrome family protein